MKTQLLALCAVGLLAATASADLALELRLPGGAAPGGNLFIDAPDPTAPVQLELWGVLTEATDPATSEIMLSWFAATSSNGGLLLGDLNVATVSGAPPDNIWWTFGLYDPPQADVDGDGDLDALGGDPADYKSFGSWNKTPFYYLNPLTTGLEQKLATVTFTPHGTFNDPTSATEIEVLAAVLHPVSTYHSGWREDGIVESGPASTLNKAVLVLASDAAPVADANDGAVGILGGDLVLDGAMATGSVNWWRWNVGNGAYRIEGTAQGGPAIPVDDLLLAGVPMGVVPVTVTVGWSASDPGNLDTATFDVLLVPEPATLALLAAGAASVWMRRRPRG